MTANKVVLGALTAFLAAALGTAAVSATGRPVEPPAVADPSVPELERDLGRGERLLLVVGGAFATREEAEAANSQIAIGDLQGFYVAAVDQFVGLEQVLGDANAEYVLVSAFRTSRGAQEFLDLVRTAGYPASLTPRLENLGYEYVGLGQESAPDGIGPLTDPIPGVTV